MSIVYDIVSENPEILLNGVGINQEDCIFIGKEIRSVCPVHENSDNQTAFCLYTDTGNWACYSKMCHETHGSSPVDLVSAVLKLNNKAAYARLMSWYGLSGVSGEMKESYLPKKDLLWINAIEEEVNTKSYFKPVSLDKYKSLLIKDTEYFSKKGFYEETIDKFLIGLCKKPGKPMSGRAFSLILDNEGKNVIGMTGRWANDKVPDNIPKWKHYGAEVKKVCYNIWNAHKEIEKSGGVIILESPKDVWWLDQCNIKNTVCVLGASVNIFHARELLKANAKKCFICFDNDKTGIERSEKASDLLSSYFSVVNVTNKFSQGRDPDEHTKEQVCDILKGCY